MRTQEQLRWVVRQGLAIALVTPLAGFLWGMEASASLSQVDLLKAGAEQPSMQEQFPELKRQLPVSQRDSVAGTLVVNCFNYPGATFKFLECHRTGTAAPGGPKVEPYAASVLRWQDQERLVTQFDSNFPDNTVSPAKRGEVQFIF